MNRKGKKVEASHFDESWDSDSCFSRSVKKQQSYTDLILPENKSQQQQHIQTKEKTEDSMIKGINKYSFIFISDILYYCCYPATAMFSLPILRSMPEEDMETDGYPCFQNS